ncbi:unnamed protein product [Darwinula stevensoni]|uniref:Eukaryotic translation initiation factor 3 subunit I n=1 Tax=Darwinula stevensoni TaxID=69355 RepID=A0A7R9AER8_9CRUS|nr:unnamed protein product [Darwinula stevensoni]CAG0902166.1 unnamed protein product [Darwinula stevensoni]
MKPLMLHGHERSITKIKYNREGDLLFSASKDKSPNVWYSSNGERLGTYDGHTGTVWTFDVDWRTQYLLTGSSDNTLRMWDVETGKCLGMAETETAVRTCAFSFGGNTAIYTTDETMGKPCELIFIDIRGNIGEEDAIFRIPVAGSAETSAPKVTASVWGTLDNFVITGHANGDLVQWDMKMGRRLDVTSEHGAEIRDMQTSADGTMFITASKDKYARLFDTDSVTLLKSFKTERPVNSAAISPNNEHVVLGGGQEAMEVTQTSSRVGKFEARFFHLVFEEEFGRVKGHFGPINSLAFQPDGTGYSSGGEDGYVRVHNFDRSYLDFKFDY